MGRDRDRRGGSVIIGHRTRVFVDSKGKVIVFLTSGVSRTSRVVGKLPSLLLWGIMLRKYNAVDVFEAVGATYLAFVTGSVVKDAARIAQSRLAEVIVDKYANKVSRDILRDIYNDALKAVEEIFASAVRVPLNVFKVSEEEAKVYGRLLRCMSQIMQNTYDTINAEDLDKILLSRNAAELIREMKCTGKIEL